MLVDALRGDLGHPVFLYDGVSFPVRVVHSKRARRIWVKVRTIQEIEIVLPYAVSAREVPAILARHQGWIMQRLEGLHQRGQRVPALPQEIFLACTGERFAVQVKKGKKAALAHQNQLLVLTQATAALSEGISLLQDWLRAQARKVLPDMLRACSRECALPFGKVHVRNQRTRWGSCSVAGTLSLNAKLLLIAPPLARHVLLHELCHLVHRHHGPAFWRALEQLDPQTAQHDQALRQAWESLPLWAQWKVSGSKR